MKTIGIKLADGSFYPVLQEGTKEEKQLDLTTAHNNQTRVMVDMYRSKNCSIEDAEYVDTLQIDNLIAHPNGEANISFTVSLDEDNNLFAKIVDSETGAQSKTTITLVSRTLEERLVPDTYEIKESPTIETSLNNNPADEMNTAKKAAVSAGLGGGLLAAAMKLNKELAEKDEDEVSEPVEDEIEIVEEDPTIAETIEETAIDESEIMDSFELPETEAIAEFKSEEEFPEAEAVAEPGIESAGEPPAEDFNLDDFDLNLEETPTAEEIPADETDIFAADDFDLPDMSTEGPAATEETDIFSMDDLDLADMPAEENAAETSTDDFNFDDLNLEDSPVDNPVAETEDADIFNTDDLNLEETPAAEEIPADETDIFAADDFDLPDMSTEEPAATEETDIFSMDDLDLGETSAVETVESSTDDFSFDDLDIDESALPVEDSAEEATEEPDIFSTDDLNLPDIDMNETSDIPDMSDFDVTETVSAEENTTDEDSDIFSMDDMNDLGSMGSTLVAADPFNLDGLYDTPSFDESEDDYVEHEEEEVSKKTKAPVIICVICAVICILATLLVLFIIPSKYNLIGKDKTSEKTEIVNPIEPETVEPEATEDADAYDVPNFDYETVEEPVFEEPEEIPQAKEDEVVIIEEAEKVVPIVPEIIEEKPADISYKIKWGDTLWDIADTYYKNPWRYKAIAKYNGIKNPDYIISGTIIAIPAE